MKYLFLKSNQRLVLLSVGYLALFYTPFVWNMDVMYSLLVAKTFYFYAVSFILFLIIYIYLFISNSPAKIEFNWLDISVLVYLLYQFLRLLYTDYVSVYNSQFIIHLSLTVHYFIIKALLKRKISCFIFITAILTSGLGQAIYGLMQLYNLNPGYPTHYFKVVGTIGNPNSYAGFLISILPFAFALYQFINANNRINQFLKYFALITTGAIILILPLTNTRGAWVAGSAGLLFILFHKYNIGDKIKQVINTKLKVILSAITVVVLLGSLFNGLYHLKPDSAFGRLFIWKITANMIKDKPVFGIGYNRYIVEYNNYQADYFANNEGSDYEIKVADNNKQAHNDYLQMTSEVGISGLIIFLALVFFVLYKRNTPVPGGNSNESIALDNSLYAVAGRASILALLVFAMFSYPLRLLVTHINFFVFLAMVSAGLNYNARFSLNLRLWPKKALVTIMIIFILLIANNKYSVYNAHKTWQMADLCERVGLLDKTIVYCKSIYLVLFDDGKFLFFYGGVLFKKINFNEAYKILTDTKQYFSDPNLDILLAKTAIEKNELDAAEKYLNHAINMTPNKFYPRYLLLKLYMRMDEKNKAYNIAKELYVMKIKVNSPAIRDMKKEMQFLLDSLQVQL